jgi:hypothetical protein
LFQVGVARGKAEKLLAMEEEEGGRAAIALRNEGEGRRPRFDKL